MRFGGTFSSNLAMAYYRAQKSEDASLERDKGRLRSRMARMIYHELFVPYYIVRGTILSVAPGVTRNSGVGREARGP